MGDAAHGLLEQVALLHGPHGLLGRFFGTVDCGAAEIGLRFRLRGDFAGLAELNRENRDSWTPLTPLFDPAHSDLSADAAFWLEGVDERGDTVVTHATRLFDASQRSLADEIAALGAVCEAAGARDEAAWRAALPAALASGRLMFSGGVWVRPDWRRFGLTKIISRVCAAAAHTRWDIGASAGFVETRLHALGLSRAYGPYTMVEGLSFRLAWRPEEEMLLFWMALATMLDDLARFVDRRAADGARERYAHDETLAAHAAPGQR